MKMLGAVLIAVVIFVQSPGVLADGGAPASDDTVPSLPKAAKLKSGVLKRDGQGLIVLESPWASQSPKTPSSQDAISSEYVRNPGGDDERPQNGKTDHLLGEKNLAQSDSSDSSANTDESALAEQESVRELIVCTPEMPVPGCKYNDLSAALAVATPRDTIVLSSGIYEKGAIVKVPGVTIRGEPGAHIMGGAVGGKAALVIKAPKVIIDGIECSNINVRDKNGACIRVEGDDLTVRNVYFHDNENGILSGPGGGTLLVENSIFERNGFGGQAHGVYIGAPIDTFNFSQ